MEFRAILLRPKGPLTEIPKADTLFGAIASAVAVLYDNKAVEKLVDAFKGGARISSAFPYFNDTFYLPKPLSVELVDFGKEYGEAKRIRRAKYLDVRNFERALRLEPFEAPEMNVYEKVSIPRVVLDRVTNDSALYFWDEVRFREGAGLYFLYSGPDDVFRDYIEPAVRLLGDTGIGGKSTWGFGLFEPEFSKLKIDAPDSEYEVTLSNALPTKKPVLWRIFRKGGWSFERRKPKMTFIEEGSVVKNDPGRFEELDLGLSFRVHIYGLTFPVPTLLPDMEGLK
ncbi:type III-A CRISPR-associated RAMP protein Csm4 [Pyrococcus yayanosii]|nr:type III-A CRISPR-associated RAMP protein Csm4 [Pyrococcus yayanosii]